LPVAIQAATEVEARGFRWQKRCEWKEKVCLPCCLAVCHLQGSSVSWWATAFPSDVVAGGSILALASLVTVIPIGALLTTVLTAPAPETCSTVASPRDGVAQSPIFALAPTATVRPPVVTIAG
jgi:hypothetical protein